MTERDGGSPGGGDTPKVPALPILRLAARVNPRVATIGGVVLIALVAAVVSYSHMRDFAHGAGEDWRAWFIPIAIDGLTVAASMTMFTRWRVGLPAGPLAWGALGCSVAVSIAVNVADVAAVRIPSGMVTFITLVLAGWAPVALAVGVELIRQQSRAEEMGTPVEVEVSAPVVVPDDRKPPAVPIATMRRAPNAVIPPQQPHSDTETADRGARGDRIRMREAWRHFDDEHESGVGRPVHEIATKVGVSTRQLRRYREKWRHARKLSKDERAA